MYMVQLFNAAKKMNPQIYIELIAKINDAVIKII